MSAWGEIAITAWAYISHYLGLYFSTLLYTVSLKMKGRLVSKKFIAGKINRS